MLAKLLKFEFKSTYRSYLFLYLVILISSFLVPQVLDSDGIFAIAVNITYTVSLFGLLIMMFVNIIQNYRKTMYGKQAYLTHTLPVSTNKLLACKCIAALVWMLVSIFIVIISGFIVGQMLTYANFDITILVDAFFESITLMILINLVLSLLQTILLFYMIISLVHTRYIPKHKAFAGIVIFIVFAFIDAHFNQLFMLNNNFIYIGSGTFEDQLGISILYSLTLCVIEYIVTKYILDHKMEIE